MLSYTQVRWNGVDDPKRKQIRLPDYDYSSAGAYFVTICTQNRRCFLSRVDVGAIHESPVVRLTAAGRIVRQTIDALPQRYPHLFVDHSVIMPNHVHLLIRLEAERAIRESPLQPRQSTLAKAIGSLKMISSRQIRLLKPDLKVWQRSYYDHLIRSEQDYLEIWEYIDGNPAKWADDKYYIDP